MRFLAAAVTPVAWADLARGVRAAAARDGVAEFERALGAYFGGARAFTFGSLMRSVKACMMAVRETSTRRRVVLSRYSCPSFAHGILAAGLEIEYCDTDPRTLAFDMDCFRRIDLSRACAVVCANLFGLAYPVRDIAAACRAGGAALVEGVDYGIGTESGGARLGTLGDFAILNFQEGKALPIGGGAVITRHADAMERVLEGSRRRPRGRRMLMLAAFRILTNPHAYGLFIRAVQTGKINLRRRFSMEDTIRKTRAEYDYAPEGGALDSVSDFQAGVGAALLEKLERHIEARRRNAAILEEALGGVRGVELIERDPGLGKTHYIRYPCLVAAARRDGLIAHLHRRRIEASWMYVDQGMKVDAARFPGAQRIRDCLVTLPCHPHVTAGDARRIAQATAEFLA